MSLLQHLKINPAINLYAIKPLEDIEIAVTRRGRIGVISQQADAILAELVIGTEKYKAGTKLLIRGESAHQKWNEAVQSFDGVRFVMCPTEWVIAFGEGI